MRSGTDQLQKVYNTAPQYQLYRLLIPQEGGAVDVHKAIGKLPKPKGGWTLPGHKYTGPYNDLENQVSYNPETGEILEVYDAPTGKTDAIAMQHDVDYSVCGDDKKCKHQADRKMVRSLDAVPWNETQWGHWLARNAINTKQKVGLGQKKKTTENQSRLKKSWQEELADQLHKPIKRYFPKRRVIVHHVDDIWCSDLVEMQKLSKCMEKIENKPKVLWVDKGKEYYNRNVLYLLAKNDIKIYSTENEEKSSVCERWNRTIKTKMYKQFTIRNNTVYIDILPKNTFFL